MYHSVGDNPVSFTVLPEEFERQVRYIREKNFRVVFLSQLVQELKRGIEPIRTVVLTLDDGYADNFIAVLPILKKYKIPATLFIVPGLTGRSLRTSEGRELSLATKDQLREMVESGFVECMPHSHNHIELDQVSEVLFVREIDGSRRETEKITGKMADIFAYPRGKYSETTIDYLRKNGWSAAVTVREGIATIDSDMFQLPRNFIGRRTSFSEFKVKVSGIISVYIKLRSWI